MGSNWAWSDGSPQMFLRNILLPPSRSRSKSRKKPAGGGDEYTEPMHGVCLMKRTYSFDFVTVINHKVLLLLQR
jgi:hypothetical protein